MNEQVGEGVRRAREAAGLTQGDVVRKLAQINVEMSVSTLSRSEAGAREFKEPELQAIREVFRTWHVGVPLTSEPDSPEHRTPSSKAQELLRRRAVAFSITGVLIGVLGLLGMIVVMMSRVAPTGHSDTQAIMAAGCDHFRVAAHDLWLRDQYGETVVQLPHNTDIVYSGKQNASGYWEITTADGKRGWVDSSFLKPHC
ncbi:helix-turn-helix domain-containing protein [Sphaerisporangium corydalis]|uniref:Helix-turn-helix domain-containing protein n=2 Tax=Sphaerisporangium corydalis TaxID=1441875 RepID=A0ABV9ES10_9ACTN